MSRFLAPRLASLEAYVPGEQPREMEYVKLNTNESPYPPCPAVERAVSPAAVRRLNLYPDPAGLELRRALAARYGLSPENVLLGNGSDEILNFAFTAFASPEKGAACPDISYGFYPVFAALHGLPLLEVPLKEDFTLCPEDYYGLDRVIVFANPNAPTGLAIRPEQVENVLRHNPDSVVVVDEAYVDFGAESCAKLVEKYDNLVVCMTFSKSRSMAGARLGFALAQPALIADLETIRCSTNPYNINSLTLAAGAAIIWTTAAASWRPAPTPKSSWTGGALSPCPAWRTSCSPPARGWTGANSTGPSRPGGCWCAGGISPACAPSCG